MLAVINVTKHAETKALKATFVIEARFSCAAKDDKAPIIIPIDAGFAKLQIAKVEIADDRAFKI